MSSEDFAKHMEQIALRVLPEFMGEPNRALSSKSELRFGKNGNLSVDLVKGVWQDHEDQTGGGVLDLLKAFKGMELPQALEWMQSQGFIEKRERANGNGHADGSYGSPQGKFAGFMDDHPEVIYEYHDDRGRLAYEVLKFAKTAPRRYMQRRKHPKGGWIWGLQEGLYGKVKSGDWFKAKADKKYEAEEHIEEAPRWLYRRDEVLKAKTEGRPIVLVEGEKDAETVRSWGMTATTNAGGAKYWHESFDRDLAGADIIICHDNDDAGRQRAALRGASLTAVAKTVRVLDLAEHWPGMPEKNDVSDWRDKAGGTAEQFGALTAKAPIWKPAPPKSRFHARQWSDLDRPGVELDYIIDDWMTERGRSVIGGPSGSGKSFLGIHAGMCIARGTPFLGHQVKQGGVIYQAGEGGTGIWNRLKAYRKHFNVPTDEDVPVVVLPAKIDLFSREGDTQALIDEINAWKLVMTHPLRVIFIDTLATATIGADENSGKDMSVVLANIAEIEERCRAHVCLVHHMNADGKKLRGHTSIHANVDQVITVTKDETTNIRTARLAKSKENEDNVSLRFELASVKVGYSERRQKDVTSCVVLPVGEKQQLKKEQERHGFSPNPTERRVLMNLFAAVDRHGKFVANENDGPRAAVGKIIVDWNTYRDVVLERMPEIEDRANARDVVRKEFARVKDALQKFGVIGVQNPHMWWQGKPIRGFPRTFAERGNNAENYGKNAGNSVEDMSAGMAEAMSMEGEIQL